MRISMLVTVCCLAALAQGKVGYKLSDADLFLAPPPGFHLLEAPAVRFMLLFNYPRHVTYWSRGKNSIEIRETDKPISCPANEGFAAAVESIRSMTGIEELQTSKAREEIVWRFRRVAPNTSNLEIRVILRSLCTERTAVLVQGLAYGEDKVEVDKIAEEVFSAVRRIELQKRKVK